MRRLIPSSTRAALRRWHREYALRRGLATLARLSDQEELPEALSNRLIYGWGNEDWSSGPEYLRFVRRAALDTTGPVLECGSGLTTLVLGVLARPAGRPVHVLEHDIEWAERILFWVEAAGFTTVDIHRVPLISYGPFSWYDVSGLLLPETFGLVVCDGPPGDTPGGRIGLLPVLHHRLPGAVVVLDDANRDGEQEAMRAWQSRYQARAEDSQSTGAESMTRLRIPEAGIAGGT